MKYKALAVLAVAGAVGFSGAAFAGVNISVKVDSPAVKVAVQTQTKKLPPKFEQGKRPEMPPMRSRDMRNRERPPRPPKGMSRDKRPPRDGDRKPPMPPRSHDRRPDKRPPEFRK